jgi:hypothetical protein
MGQKRNSLLLFCPEQCLQGLQKFKWTVAAENRYLGGGRYINIFMFPDHEA